MKAGRTNFVHGMHKTTIYKLWTSMMQRCTNPAGKDYPRYGGRGITVCERWTRFENFYADMGLRPEGKTLDRIDNDKGYSPDNCRWATLQEQMRNSRQTVMITRDGKTQCLKDWQRDLGLPASTYTGRRMRGWSVERALESPVFYPRHLQRGGK